MLNITMTNELLILGLLLLVPLLLLLVVRGLLRCGSDTFSSQEPPAEAKKEY